MITENHKDMEKFNVNIEILRLLSLGHSQKEVSEELKRKGIFPNSISSVDKKLKSMRDEWNCKTVFQLMYKVGKTKLV
jgi:DNA-binding NarL/FixJ family response regulator